MAHEKDPSIEDVPKRDLIVDSGIPSDSNVIGDDTDKNMEAIDQPIPSISNPANEPSTTVANHHDPDKTLALSLSFAEEDSSWELITENSLPPNILQAIDDTDSSTEAIDQPVPSTLNPADGPSTTAAFPPSPIDDDVDLEDPDMQLAIQLSLASTDNDTEAIDQPATSPSNPLDEQNTTTDSTLPAQDSDPIDLDMLLALQLSTTSYSSDSDSAFPDLQPDLPPSYSEDFDLAELARATSESLRPDTAAPWRPTPPRDRYDVAGIATYRVDPRRRGGFHSRAQPGPRLLDSSWNPFDFPRPRVTWPRGEARAEVVPLAVAATSQEAAKEKTSCPILDPGSGAPMLNILDADTLLYLVNNFLYFPDAFALALTCKSIHGVTNLKFQKRKYHALLTSQHGAAVTLPGIRGFCEVCLYVLPASYFPRGGHVLSTSMAEEPGGVDSKICTDCVDFRARVQREAERVGEDSAIDGGSQVAPVWRPSRRVVIEGTEGALWYRERE